MNIFILDTDLKRNAQYYCDKHLIKMILETAQMMCTVCQIKGIPAPYKPTHINHPCTRWLLESGANWDLLFDLVTELNNEYKLRFNHINNHKSYDVILSLTKPKYINNTFTGMFNSVTDEVRRTNITDTINYYRNYYKFKLKSISMTWTNINKPKWLDEVNIN